MSYVIGTKAEMLELQAWARKVADIPDEGKPGRRVGGGRYAPNAGATTDLVHVRQHPTVADLWACHVPDRLIALLEDPRTLGSLRAADRGKAVARAKGGRGVLPAAWEPPDVAKPDVAKP